MTCPGSTPNANSPPCVPSPQKAQHILDSTGAHTCAARTSVNSVPNPPSSPTGWRPILRAALGSLGLGAPARAVARDDQALALAARLSEGAGLWPGEWRRSIKGLKSSTDDPCPLMSHFGIHNRVGWFRNLGDPPDMLWQRESEQLLQCSTSF